MSCGHPTFDRRLQHARAVIAAKYGGKPLAPLMLQGTDTVAEAARLRHYDDPFPDCRATTPKDRHDQ